MPGLSDSFGGNVAVDSHRIGCRIESHHLIAMQLGAMFGPPPPDPRGLFIVSIAAYSLLAVAWWIDRHREAV